MFATRFLNKPSNNKITHFKSVQSHRLNLKGSRSFSTNLPAYVVNVPPTRVTALPNQLRVATEESLGETATVGVFLDAGSAYENEHNNGVAHFLEHMAFKGTSKRTREALEVEIENIGGTLNAYTSREQTVYYAKVFKNDVPRAMDILSDILLNSTYNESGIEQERSTILREMEEVNKDYNEVVFDHLHAAAFQGNSLGRTILGPEENIKKINRNDLMEYVKTHYQPHRIVVAASGAVKHENIVQLAESSFGRLQSTDNSRPIVKPSIGTLYTGSSVTVSDETMDNVHVALAVEGVGWSHPDYFSFMIIQALSGSWDRSIGGGKNLSSRLCETFATEGLALSLNTFNTCYNETGLFGAHFVSPIDKVDDAVYETLMEWGRFARNVTDSEVERAKNKLKASVLMNIDGTTAVAEDIGRQVLTHGRRLTPAEIFARIDAITAKDIKRVAKQYLEDACPTVSAYGNLRNFPDYSYIRRWTSWTTW